jgi:hypothetical protein
VCDREQQLCFSARPSPLDASPGPAIDAAADEPEPAEHQQAIEVLVDAGGHDADADASTRAAADSDAQTDPAETAAPPEPPRAAAGSPGAAGGGAAGAAGVVAATPVAGGGAGVGGGPICPTNELCQDFESGVLRSDGGLWPSPSEQGELPLNGELTTAELPVGSGNHVLVCQPSKLDAWPKATVGHTEHAAYRKLTIGFDFAVSQSLASAPDRVAIFRLMPSPAAQTGAVYLLLNGPLVLLNIERGKPEDSALETVAMIAPPNTLTHVSLVFERRVAQCMVGVTYGSSPTLMLAMPCELSDWQVEFGLDIMRDMYADSWSAYYDNLRVVATP